jgi:hypothetical protein
MAASAILQLPALDAFLTVEDICAVGAAHPSLLAATQRRLTFAAVLVATSHRGRSACSHQEELTGHATSLQSIVEPIAAPSDWFLSRIQVRIGAQRDASSWQQSEIANQSPPNEVFFAEIRPNTFDLV